MLLLLSLSFAQDAYTRSAYEARYPLMDNTHPDYTQVLDCLRSWGEHPFSTPESQRFRVIESSVRVMGFGSSEVVDNAITTYPQLIVIRPNVSVMTRTTWMLSNPNGWYCFDTSVAVAAKGEIDLACGAHVADSHDAVGIVASSDRSGGVTVLGAIEVRQVGECPK